MTASIGLDVAFASRLSDDRRHPSVLLRLVFTGNVLRELEASHDAASTMHWVGICTVKGMMGVRHRQPQETYSRASAA